MSRDDHEIQRRPQRVIILDADDPMTEIHGRFLWQEDHDRILDETRRESFEAGFEAGKRAAMAEPPPTTYELQRRSRPRPRFWLLILVLAAICLLLASPLFLGR